MSYLAKSISKTLSLKSFKTLEFTDNELDTIEKIISDWNINIFKKSIEEVSYFDCLEDDTIIVDDFQTFSNKIDNFISKKILKYPYYINRRYGFCCNNSVPYYETNYIISLLLEKYQNLMYAVIISDRSKDTVMEYGNILNTTKFDLISLLNFDICYNKSCDSTVYDWLDDKISPFIEVYKLEGSYNPFNSSNWKSNSLTLFNLVKNSKEWLFIPLDINNEKLNYDTVVADKSYLSIKYTNYDLYKLMVSIKYLILLTIECELDIGIQIHKVVEEFVSYAYSFADDNTDCTSIAKDNTPYIPENFVYKAFNLVNNNDVFLDKSLEAINTISKVNNIKIQDIDNEYKNKSIKLKKIFIEYFKIKPSILVAKKSSKLFKKYYGRIPHLYEQYGGEATIYENKMKNDPSVILSTKAMTYINKMSISASKIFESLIQVSQKVVSSSSINLKMNVVKEYCKKFKVEDSDDPNQIRKQIINETSYRICESIFQDISVYGFTIDSVMENKKFPPANHIVTSMFIQNPHEQPIEQSVNQIFSNPNSILLFAKPETIVKFDEAFKQASMNIINSFNYKNVSMTKKNLLKGDNMFNNAVKQDDSASVDTTTDPKEQKKKYKAIEKGIIDSLNIVIEQKSRCLQCVGTVHNMLSRITNLAKRCLGSMLEVERSKTDKDALGDTYNTARIKDKNRSINKMNSNNRRHVEGMSEDEKEKSKNTKNILKDLVGNK